MTLGQCREVHEHPDWRVNASETYDIMSMAMNSGRIGCELAMVAVCCVLAIFLFPSMQGPYSVVNGPVTASQAARAAAHLQIAIMQAAVRSPGNLLITPIRFFWPSLAQSELRSGTSPDCVTILRC